MDNVVCYNCCIYWEMGFKICCMSFTNSVGKICDWSLFLPYFLLHSSFFSWCHMWPTCIGFTRQLLQEICVFHNSIYDWDFSDIYCQWLIMFDTVSKSVAVQLLAVRTWLRFNLVVMSIFFILLILNVEIGVHSQSWSMFNPGKCNR